jgi:hypothetical protein
VWARNSLMRSYFDVACHSVPLFMALGNHDGESGWLGDATADNTYAAFNADAYDSDSISFPGVSYDPTYGVIMPNAGYLNVTVSPDRVTESYIRAVLPGDEATAGAANGAAANSYSVTAR